MIFGLIGDVHANLPALETVLAELDALGIKKIFDVGDLASYGPFPDEAISLLRDRGVVSIQGNRDRQVYEFHQADSIRAGGKLTAIEMKALAYEWAYNKLSAENLSYLRSLPERLSVCVSGRRMLMIHSAPLKPDTLDHKFEEIAGETEEDIIAFGHTHIPFVKKIAGKLFVNTGSVGRGENGDSRAAYVILTVEQERTTAQVKHVSYDLDKIVEAVYKSDLPDEFALMYTRGTKLDNIVEFER